MKQDDFLIRRSLERKSFLNYQDSDGNSALHLAITLNRPLDVMRLVEVGANVSLKNRMGSTPLHLAAFYNQVDILNLLIKSGANFDATDKEGFTPLHFASLYGNVPTVRALIGAGAVVNAVNARGWTPVHLATLKSEAVVVRILLDAGANPNTLNHYGNSPLRTAINTRNNLVMRLLRDRGAKLDTEMVSRVGVARNGSNNSKSIASSPQVASHAPKHPVRITRNVQGPVPTSPSAPVRTASASSPTTSRATPGHPRTAPVAPATKPATTGRSGNDYINLDPWNGGSGSYIDKSGLGAGVRGESSTTGDRPDSIASIADVDDTSILPDPASLHPLPARPKAREDGYGKYIASFAGWKPEGAREP